MALFTAESAVQAAIKSHLNPQKGHIPANARGRPAKRSQIIAMQRVLFEKVLHPDTEPHKAAQCACAYEKLEERLRIMSGTGAPKPVEARNAQAKPKRKPSVEPTDIPPG